jgi:replicative DNA helicase
MAVNMCENYKVGFISLEMTKEELLDKIVSQVCHVKSSALTINVFSDWDKQNLKEF